ncbi:hypothetical protein [Streptomyces collinus]|uniref:hypothetical protein n=1 Tax=Streptomyces collinus TaxID=42684 RepID=UPI0034054763
MCGGVRPQQASGGRLDLVVAAGQSHRGAYLPKVDWQEPELNGPRFFGALRANMRQSYDWILIDSPTGVNDDVDICTTLLPDDLVVGYTFSDQSMVGTAQVAGTIKGWGSDRPARILLLAMRVDDSEPEKAELARAYAGELFTGVGRGLNTRILESHGGRLEIPYRARYAYNETLAIFGDEPSDPQSMLSACERLVAVLTDGQVTSLPPMDDRERLTYLEQYTNPQGPPDALVM